MIYATGDTHGNFQRFAPEHFPEQAGMTKEDYMIICGDFGGVWDGGKKEERNLDWLEDLPFTTLFISGNHENFDLLRKYPTEEWNGGKIQRIRPHVIHLMRGQVFDLQGYENNCAGNDYRALPQNPWKCHMRSSLLLVT